MATSRKDLRKKRFRRRIKIFISVVLIFAVAFVGYIYYEYQQGKRAAEAEMGESYDPDRSEEDRENFEGAESSESNETNVLILGVDAENGGSPRTDTIMIGQYDPDEDRAKLVSIMRDTYVSIPGYSDNKINSAFAYGGPELLRQTIKENFDIDIHYYAMVNFKGFESIVDTVSPDGVEIDVEKRMQYSDWAGEVNIDLYPGVQKLNGSDLLDYARFRADHENDFGRVRRQQQVISALKEEILSFTGVSRLPRAVGTLEPYVDTNMGTSTIISILTDYFRDTPDEIETFRIPVEGSYSDASYNHAGSVLEIDQEQNKEALKEFLGKSEDQDVDDTEDDDLSFD
ncbi:LCP family protein [Alkalibacillus aidingensis]|uniref:LCP family protein n=1 Tax=Alkalibacillus aidingensis TaxID=2747607 RepID=UPI0016600BB5|nr:LCP family protein [Alkalibacillus aidingensis]